MSDLMTLIKERRSVRTYKEDDIPGEALDQILEAVRWAPSWNNTQCWEVVVIRDAAVKKKLQEVVSPKNPSTRAVVVAPVLLALCAKRDSSGFYEGKVTTKFGDWFMFDLGLAAQNLCLMAHELGLGTVIVGLFDHDQANTILNVPAGYDTVALIPLGYPAKVPQAPKRREIAEFSHEGTF